MPCGIFLLLFILLFVFRRFLPVHGGAGAIGGDFLRLIRRFMQMQPKIAAIEEAAQKIKTLNYRQYENPQLEALAAEIMENTAGLKE